MKMFKSITKVKGVKEPFVDWFHALSLETAQAMWRSQATAFGVPLQDATVTFTEVDPATLKPVN